LWSGGSRRSTLQIPAEMRGDAKIER
jgi:hypothetical protein